MQSDRMEEGQGGHTETQTDKRFHERKEEPPGPQGGTSDRATLQWETRGDGSPERMEAWGPGGSVPPLETHLQGPPARQGEKMDSQGRGML